MTDAWKAVLKDRTSQMPTIHTLSWSLELPDDWQIEQDETCISAWWSNSVGVLQFSTARKNESVTDSDLREFAAEYLNRNKTLKNVNLGEFSGFDLSYETQETSWRHWYLRSGSIMLFVTYNCDVNDAGVEDQEVDTVLAKLKLR